MTSEREHNGYLGGSLPAFSSSPEKEDFSNSIAVTSTRRTLVYVSKLNFYSCVRKKNKEHNWKFHVWVSSRMNYVKAKWSFGNSIYCGYHAFSLMQQTLSRVCAPSLHKQCMYHHPSWHVTLEQGAKSASSPRKLCRLPGKDLTMVRMPEGIGVICRHSLTVWGHARTIQ